MNLCVLFASLCVFFFFNDTATTEIYTLSLHDALPISLRHVNYPSEPRHPPAQQAQPDRKSTRLNSSHANISYAVFCLKKKKKYNSSFYQKKKKKKKKHNKKQTKLQ